jgi:glycosyltransferase involved in cell wall biosynthesis
MNAIANSALQPILLTVEDLGVGGAQVFALRLAQALHEVGNKVFIFSHYHHLGNATLRQQLAPDVEAIEYGKDYPRFDWLLRKAEGLFRRFGIRVHFRQRLVIWQLRKVVRLLRPHILNSHTIKADYVAARALSTENGTSQVITMHGCYELFLRHVDTSEVVPMGKYALEHAASFVYLTDKNLEIFTRPAIRPLMDLPHRKIYNGFAGHFTNDPACNRAALGIGEGEVVFGMVARGIAEKGWEYAIHSYLAIQAEHPTTHLVLVGKSDYLTSLRAKYMHPHIHFVGHSSNPVDWIKLFDVALLPSYFHAESLPNSIAEYLFCGKPVVASRIGEVPHMLESTAGLAGVIIDQADWKITNPEQLTQAMRAYLLQPNLLQEHKLRAALAFEKFRMEQCVSAYTSIYNESLITKQYVNTQLRRADD